MTKLIYSTEEDFSGPWLLDGDALLHLDAILDEEIGRLTIERNERLSQDSEASAKRLYPNLSGSELVEKQEGFKKTWLEETPPVLNRYRIFKGVSVKFANKQTIEADSFKDIIRDYSASEAMPISFAVDIQCGEVRGKLTTRDYFDRKLSISVTPEDNRGARELFVVLRQWATNNMAPGWQTLWARISSYGLHWVIWFVAVAFSFSAWGIYAAAKTISPAEEAAKVKAYQLIDAGISNANLQEAIETMLMLQTKYYPGQSTSVLIPLPGWLKAWFIVGLAVCTILSIRPGVVLGIGKGTARIKVWRQWLNIVWVTIPGLVFASFGWPIIEQAIRTLFK